MEQELMQIEKIVSDKYSIKARRNNRYTVKSKQENKTYKIKKDKSCWCCSCNGIRVRKHLCKHVLLVIEFLKNLIKKIKIKPAEIIRCTHCKLRKFRKNGIRHNKSGDVQRYECLKCNREFCGNVGFERARVDPKWITLAIDLYFSGMSFVAIEQCFKRQGCKVSFVSIYKWVVKYTKLIHAYLSKFSPKVGIKWHTDEMYVKINGEIKWLFAITDSTTRFFISYELGDTKEGHNAIKMFNSAQQITRMVPSKVVSDGSPVYPFAIKNAFKSAIKKPTHIKEIHMQKKRKNNNKQERFNGSIRDREKVLRGLKTTSSPFFEGMWINYNFIRPHSSLNGNTPAEKAGIVIQGDNKWRILIENAALAN